MYRYLSWFNLTWKATHYKWPNPSCWGIYVAQKDDALLGKKSLMIIDLQSTLITVLQSYKPLGDHSSRKDHSDHFGNSEKISREHQFMNSTYYILDFPLVRIKHDSYLFREILFLEFMAVLVIWIITISGKKTFTIKPRFDCSFPSTNSFCPIKASPRNSAADFARCSSDRGAAYMYWYFYLLKSV